jgi:hypothetical protein
MIRLGIQVSQGYGNVREIMTLRRVCANVTSSVFVFPLFLSMTLCLCACNLCQSTVLSVSESPNAKARAYILENNCGATVDYARQVTLTHDATPPKPGLTESVAEKGTVCRAGGQPDISLVWKSDDSLTVFYHLENPSDRIFRHDSTWEGISVEFIQKKLRP